VSGNAHLRSSQWTIAIAALLCIAFVVWACVSDVEQIARAQGQVIASERTQVIQSAIDGVIEQLPVKEGQRVSKGQALVKLDPSQAQASYQDSAAKVAALKAALTRLRAEVFERKLEFPSDTLAYPAFVSNQTELYQRRLRALNAEISALQSSANLVKQELDLNTPLLASGDIGKTDVLRLERQITEINAQITNRRNKYFQDAQAEMTKAEEDLTTQQEILSDKKTTFERTEIKSPTDGLVKKIYITTTGAKLRQGEVVMDVLPLGGKLIVEAKIIPSDVAHVRKGLPAAIKLDAYDYSIYGVLRGTVNYISPDALSEDTKGGKFIYYIVQVEIDEAALAEKNQAQSAKKIEIQPGMIATVEIRTGKQKVITYLTKPISKTFSESMRER
jgi:adhesin transport system membrane fusion protein